MNLSKRLMKALRNAQRRAYPDFDAVCTLDEQGYVAISASCENRNLSPNRNWLKGWRAWPKNDLNVDLTDTGKQALKDWEAENEVRI